MWLASVDDDEVVVVVTSGLGVQSRVHLVIRGGVTRGVNSGGGGSGGGDDFRVGRTIQGPSRG